MSSSTLLSPRPSRSRLPSSGLAIVSGRASLARRRSPVYSRAALLSGPAKKGLVRRRRRRRARPTSPSPPTANDSRPPRPKIYHKHKARVTTPPPPARARRLLLGRSLYSLAVLRELLPLCVRRGFLRAAARPSFASPLADRFYGRYECRLFYGRQRLLLDASRGAMPPGIMSRYGHVGN